ncbi:MAG: aminotransferase class I/II-fold pyridoxal phosphate-dependent enzyme [Actinomycetota bacterium]
MSAPSITAAARAAAVPPFHAMAMARRAAELEADGRTVLHLEIGEPSATPPTPVVDAVRDALERPLGYTPALGNRRLRLSIAEQYDGVDASRIAVVAGASAAFTLAFVALFEPGDRVAVIEPGYPCYRNTLQALGVETVPVAVGPADRWAPTPDAIDRAAAGRGLDGLVLASPSNPTGTVIGDPALADLVGWARARGVRIVADEIYGKLVDGPGAPSVLSHDPDAIVISSFSKYWCLTGWRVGWMVLPESLVDTVERLQQNLLICAPHISQIAALAALGAGGSLDTHVATYRDNRQLLLDGLAAAGIADVAPADGAFYVYAHVPQLTSGFARGSMDLCERWLDELSLATTPGVDFDPPRGHEYVRFSVAGRAADLSAACDRIASWAS